MTDTTVRALAVSPNGAGGSNLFAGTYGGVFLSTNKGANWTAVNTGLTTAIVYALAVLDMNLFSGTGDGVFLSTNNGTSWTVSNTGLPTTYPIYTFAVNGIYLFAGNYGGSVFLSTNNGTSWTAASTDLPSTTVITLAVSGANLFAGTSNGVLLSTNNGTSWTAVNTGLANTSVQSLAVSGTNLFAGTWGGGVWRRPLSEMITSVDNLSTELPINFRLEQNHPNPFNPTTSIRYALPTSANVKLSVYDLLGREIATLLNEEQSAGWKEVQWNATRFASGIYFYELSAGDFVQSRKMILINSTNKLPIYNLEKTAYIAL